jgi:hypothetical protein
MNLISNIWIHPRTSAAGLLIAAVTIAGVLTQQGITLGSAGTGTVVSLVSALGTALLGLLAKDPDPSPTSNNTAKLGALMLCAVLVSGSIPLAGCSGKQVAQDIVNWTPALQTAVAVVDSTASLLAPADAPIFLAATASFDAATNLLVAQCSLLAQLQSQIVTFQQQVNAALLQSARIVNPNSQTHALAAINGVATIVNAIFALVESISSKAAAAQMASQASIKISQVQPYLDRTRQPGSLPSTTASRSFSLAFSLPRRNPQQFAPASRSLEKLPLSRCFERAPLIGQGFSPGLNRMVDYIRGDR